MMCLPRTGCESWKGCVPCGQHFVKSQKAKYGMVCVDTMIRSTLDVGANVELPYLFRGLDSFPYILGFNYEY